MPRRARHRHSTEAACYQVLNRGHDWEVVFHEDDDRQRFLTLLARYRARLDVRLYVYCLMSNHFHLLLQVPRPAALSPLLAGLGVASWHHYRRRYGLLGHLVVAQPWQEALRADRRSPGRPADLRSNAGAWAGDHAPTEDHAPAACGSFMPG